MPIFSKQSLELLRERIDLFEVLADHLDLKRAGAFYKTCCPFHEEKTPSFMVQKADKHYHCFGCGVHGDAIEFLMNYLKISFVEAVQQLADRFQVTLEYVDKTEEKPEVNRAQLKEALELAAHFYHYILLETQAANDALGYLYSRKLNENFIKNFQIGYAPKDPKLFKGWMQAKGIHSQVLHEAGLINEKGKEFFSERIVFPIRSSAGSIIGFSGRKIKESTFGGKYINSPETVLFKKSHMLFGLNYCRKRIAKERKAIIVEGQIDCLRLIEAGLNMTVAGQGTAFGESQVKELIQLGVREVYLLFDGDEAGSNATAKIGQLFQKIGVHVWVATLPNGEDPDSFLNIFGIEKLIEHLSHSIDYLTFLISHYAKVINIETPAGKNELINTLSKQIKDWDQPIMVHETLRKLAQILQVPEEMLGIGKMPISNYFIKRSSAAHLKSVDPNRILELDLLRWLILCAPQQPQLVQLAKERLKEEDFLVPVCRYFYNAYMQAFEQNQPTDLLSLLIAINNHEAQECADEILNKKINREKAFQNIKETIQKILERQWMQKGEEIKIKIQSGSHSEEEVLELMKQLNDLKKAPPKLL